MNPKSDQSSQEIAKILESANRLGVEIDEEEALQWLAAMSADHVGASDVVVDSSSGVFGHTITMLDFSPADLGHFRRIGRLVEFEDIPGKVETALSLSGSSAQSKIQTYPGDCDYFERVNILAPTWEAACITLAEIMRQKALSTIKGPDYQLIEVKFGSYPFDIVTKDGKHKKGTPIGWLPSEIQAGKIEGSAPDGSPLQITWDDVRNKPGWCKLDWVIIDPQRRQLANASNMLDVTWEAPDGTITPLDGYLDAYFQEVYLEASSIPIFAKLVKNVSPDALDNYVFALRKEVTKYLTRDLNYGKAAKRMYNIFRLTGHYSEAAFIRELFDEPTTILYQVWSLIRTVDDAVRIGAEFPRESLLAHTDSLILAVVQALEGDQETEIVKQLLIFRDALSRQVSGAVLSNEAEAARARVINVVNNFFHDRLVAMPEIAAYISEVQAQANSH
ncbi:MAG TPA: hypothetical protein VIO61_08655 [Anaerolineaceae bacterium]